jgi:peptidoglycan/LPS O-acetylase OafA/YrhL
VLNRHQTHPVITPHNSLTYRPDIDGLRAIAILSVVFFHASIPGFSGGFVGVDIFFVISGYLITSLILKDMDNGCFSFYKFYLRRAKRIFPALIVVLAATTAAAWFVVFPFEFQKFGRSLLHTTFFASNFYFAQDAGYFSAPSIDKPLLHTWSLAIEEQFYIVFPTMLALFLPRLGRNKTPLMLLATAALSLLVAEILVRSGSETAFYMPHVRAWELLLGGFVVFQQDRIQLGRRLTLLLSAFGLGAIVFATTMFGSTMLFPGLNAILPCGGTALLLFVGGKQSTPIQAIISVTPIRFVGQVSYSLYLWHWPLFSLTHYHLDRVPNAVETAVLIGASFSLAILSWRFVEQPVRTSKIGLTNPLCGIALTSAPFVPLAVIGAVFLVTKGFPWRLPPPIADVYIQSMTKPAFLKGCASQGCRFGVPPKNNSYDIVIWGDSHAQHFAPVFKKLADSVGLSGVLLTQNGCAPILNVTVLNNDHVIRKECRDKDRIIKEFVANNENVKLIVIAARWSLYMSEDNNETRYLVTDRNADISTRNSRLVAAEELQKTVNYFRDKGLNVVVVGQVPQFSFVPIRCNIRKLLSPQNAPDCSVSLEEQYSRYLSYSNKLIAQLNNDPRVGRIFPHEFLCDNTTCKSLLNGVIMYHDRDHLTAVGAETFYQFFMEKLGSLLIRLKTERDSRN